jgi:hypothetical protein
MCIYCCTKFILYNRGELRRLSRISHFNFNDNESWWAIPDSTYNNGSCALSQLTTQRKMNHNDESQELGRVHQVHKDCTINSRHNSHDSQIRSIEIMNPILEFICDGACTMSTKRQPLSKNSRFGLENKMPEDTQNRSFCVRNGSSRVEIRTL